MKHIELRVAIIVGTFPTISETFIVNQINFLKERGFKIDILAFHNGNTSVIHKSILDNKLIEHTTYLKEIPKSLYSRFIFTLKWIFQNRMLINWEALIQTFNILKFGRIALNLNLFYQNLWFLKKAHYDIIHVHFAQNAKVIANLKDKGFLKETKLVVSFHGFDIIPNEVDKLKTEYRPILKVFDRIIANTLYTKELVSKLGQIQHKIDIIPVGLDSNFFSPLNHITSDKIKLIFCGRLISYKGCGFLMEIIRELVLRGHDNIFLNIIGEGPEKSNLESTILEFNLQNHVKLLGAQNQNEVRSIFDNSDIFVLPGKTEPDSGRAENQGLVVQEAQAMQLPVVISDAGGMREGMLPDKSGFVVEEGNLEGFVKAIEKLIKSQSLRREMGIIGRNFIVENYDQNFLGDKLIKVYKSIL